MSTTGLIGAELVAAVLAAAGFLTAGALNDRRRFWALVAAVILSAVRVAVVLLLWPAGWWFVEEKVLLSVPLAVVTAAIAVWAYARRQAPAVRLALLSAGYAAAAGPMVTLLAGYPATWSIALSVLGGLVIAAVVTARVLGLTQLRAPTVGAFTLVVLGVGVGIVAPSALDAGGGVPSGSGTVIPVTLLVGPATPDQGGTVRRFALAARQATVMVGGRAVAAWTFNGQVPGPALAVTQGDLVEVKLTNVDIADGVTLHWHGYDVPNAVDGAPGLTQDAVLPGQSFVYRFRAEQVGTYWYHTHEVSDRGVKLGLYGTLVVSPRAAEAPGVDLVVPMHTLDGVFTLGDAGAGASTAGAGTPVRLRLINTDDKPRLVHVVGTPFRVVAVDGSDLNAPGLLQEVGLLIPAGGRYDVTFPMPSGGAVLRFPAAPDVSLAIGGPAGSAGASGAAGDWPVLDLLSYGAPAAVPFTMNSPFDRRFTLVLDRGLALVNGVPAYAYTVDGHAYPKVPTEVVAYGDLVEFTIVNRSFEVHPWHLHGHHVLILSRDGVAASGSPLWMDTFDVRPGEVWRVAFRADNPGLWMNHCHNLSHADDGMALHLAYDGVSSTFHGGHGG